MSARQTSPGGAVKPALEPLDFMEVQEHRASVSPQVPLKAYLDNRVRAMKMPTAVEPALCRSTYPHPQSPTGRVSCFIDHDEIGDSRHGAMVGGNFFRWTTAEATAANWRCLHCNYPCDMDRHGGYCSPACMWREAA